MNSHVIVLNGPPRSGKDTLLNQIISMYPESTHNLRFSKVLKQGAHSLLGMHDVDYEEFDYCKDEPRPEFFNLTPRQFYINLSEQFLKFQFGADIFGQLWVRKFEEEYPDLATAPIAVICDCGFKEELVPIQLHFGISNVIIMRIHREDHDFGNDSRGYIRGCGSPEFDIHNPEDDVDLFTQNAMRVLEETGTLALL